jgi:hypothetical protein
MGMRILRDNGGRFLVVSKELCYGKAETLEDAEKAARGWRYNLVKIEKWFKVLRRRVMWRDCYDKEWWDGV